MDLGASAFINKGEAMEKVADAVEKVLSGGTFLSNKLKRTRQPDAQDPEHLPDLGLDTILTTLTDRQLDILRLIGQGKSNKVIALEKQLSGNTVKVHVSAILRALDLKNRTQIGLLAQKFGLLNDNQSA